MLTRIFQRRSIWWPTWLGWLILCLFGVLPTLLWALKGEAYLYQTQRLPAEILIVEGWIGVEGVRAAKAEFDRGGYHYLVTSGGFTGKHWSARRWSHVDIAKKELLRLELPPDQLIAAPSLNAEVQRTFAAATAARKALQSKGIASPAVNVFTLGVHARRSRLIHAKVFGSRVNVGVVAWIPEDYAKEPWWKSSDRAEDFLKESMGYWFELLLNSGRMSNQD